jgi:hypothetical protein
MFFGIAGWFAEVAHDSRFGRAGLVWFLVRLAA